MTTRRESILQNIKTTLEGITLANGYSFDFYADTVQRWMQRGNKTSVVPCIVISAGKEDIKPGRNPMCMSTLSIQLDVWYQQAESDTQPTDYYLSQLFCDIQKVLLADLTRGGYAIDTNIVSYVPFETAENGIYCGIIIELEIQYEFDPLNP